MARRRRPGILHTSLHAAIKWAFLFIVGCLVLLFWIHRRSSSSLPRTMEMTIPPNYDTSHLPNKGWLRTHVPSAARRIEQRRSSKCIGQVRNDVPTSPSQLGCVILSDFGLDGLGARTTRMLSQHLLVAASSQRIGWCPMFSLTGWEVGNTAAYFRNVNKQNIYCHAVHSHSGEYPNLLSDTWWNQLRCYDTPVEQWWSIWTNCTGVMLPKPAVPHPSPFSTCKTSCHLHTANATSSPKVYWDAAIADRSKFQNVAREIVRIRAALAAAYDQNTRTFCGYDTYESKLKHQQQQQQHHQDGAESTLHVTFHVRSGDGKAYGGMGSIPKAVDQVYTLMHALQKNFVVEANAKYNRIEFHLHTETAALEPTWRGTYNELGSRLVFQDKNYAMLDDSFLVHVVLNAEPTKTMECFRSANVLVLTSSSSFGKLGGLLSGTNRVVTKSSYLSHAESFVNRKKVENTKSSGHLRGEIFGRIFGSHSLQDVSLLSWLLASLSEERKRWYGYKTLDEKGILDFILDQTLPGNSNSLGMHSNSNSNSNSNSIGACPVELVGRLQQSPNRQGIMQIHNTDFFTERQGPMVNPVDAFGPICEAKV